MLQCMERITCMKGFAVDAAGRPCRHQVEPQVPTCGINAFNDVWLHNGNDRLAAAAGRDQLQEKEKKEELHISSFNFR